MLAAKRGLRVYLDILQKPAGCTTVQLCNYTTVQLYNCTTVQLYDFTFYRSQQAVQLYNCATVPLYNCTTVQLYDCTTLHFTEASRLYTGGWQGGSVPVLYLFTTVHCCRVEDVVEESPAPADLYCCTPGSGRERSQKSSVQYFSCNTIFLLQHNISPATQYCS